jgi:hypothetical protein
MNEVEITFFPGACWTWLGHWEEKGYGRYKMEGRRRVGAHRFSYALFNESFTINRCN